VGGGPVSFDGVPEVADEDGFVSKLGSESAILIVDCRCSTRSNCARYS
jgi:hypothetical protein